MESNVYQRKCWWISQEALDRLEELRALLAEHGDRKSQDQVVDQIIRNARFLPEPPEDR